MTQIKNTEVYGLEESIIRSGYPMQIGEPADILDQASNLTYWLGFDLLKIVLTERGKQTPDLSKYGIRQCCICNDPNNIRVYKNKNYCATHYNQIIKHGTCRGSWYDRNPVEYFPDKVEIILTDKNLEERGRAIVDPEDYFKVMPYRWAYTNNYAKNSKIGFMHRLIMGSVDPSMVVDHINGDRLDNRKINLRVCSHENNCKNRAIAAKDTKTISGVSWSTEKKKWASYIQVDGKYTALGRFTDYDLAVKTRLEAEKRYYREFSPNQHLFEAYGITPLPDTLITFYRPEGLDFTEAYRHAKRAVSLGSSETSSGHANYLSGIVVNFDLKAPLYMWKQLQRYHFLQIISSQSTMHRIAHMNIREMCNEYIYPEVIDYVVDLQKKYLEDKSTENFAALIANIPSGLEYTAGMTTNYLQLATIYKQRRQHKLTEWQYFCDWIEGLPYFSELVLKHIP